VGEAVCEWKSFFLFFLFLFLFWYKPEYKMEVSQPVVWRHNSNLQDALWRQSLSLSTITSEYTISVVRWENVKIQVRLGEYEERSKDLRMKRVSYQLKKRLDVKWMRAGWDVCVLMRRRVDVHFWERLIRLGSQGQKKYTVYKTVVQTGPKKWIIYRRYNQFLEFHDALVKVPLPVLRYECWRRGWRWDEMRWVRLESPLEHS